MFINLNVRFFSNQFSSCFDARHLFTDLACSSTSTNPVSPFIYLRQQFTAMTGRGFIALLALSSLVYSRGLVRSVSAASDELQTAKGSTIRRETNWLRRRDNSWSNSTPEELTKQ
jgi:hypothetical protein